MHARLQTMHDVRNGQVWQFHEFDPRRRMQREDTADMRYRSYVAIARNYKIMCRERCFNEARNETASLYVCDKKLVSDLRCCLAHSLLMLRT